MMKAFTCLLMCVAFAASVSAADRTTITPELLRDLHRTTVRASTHESKAVAAYSGVALGDVVRKLGAPSGEAIRGKKLSLIVIVRAADGYTAVFTLAELDPAFTRKVVLLTDRRDGQPLGEKEGPFRIIVPDEKRQARWVRQVASVELREVE